jgi:hypothetical protein
MEISPVLDTLSCILCVLLLSFKISVVMAGQLTDSTLSVHHLPPRHYPFIYSVFLLTFLLLSSSFRHAFTKAWPEGDNTCQLLSASLRFINSASLQVALQLNERTIIQMQLYQHQLPFHCLTIYTGYKTSIMFRFAIKSCLRVHFLLLAPLNHIWISFL